jgi:site-specific DNA-methyltransferase (adenine-specific)
MYQIICTDALSLLESIDYVRMIMADPPDNIGLKYKTYKDNRPDYIQWLEKIIEISVSKADVFWLSYNAKWTFEVGRIVSNLLDRYEGLKAKPCVQIYTFGQHNKYDLGNNHRPLIRITQPNVELYPDEIHIESWRQVHGDKRANSIGKVPSDVFDFPRVTGNSRQRRKWHPTQLNEGLVERCVKFSCKETDTVVDPFAGTGTTLRVCQRLGIACTVGDIDYGYCKHIAEENGLHPAITKYWPAGRWYTGKGLGLANSKKDI